MFGRTRSTSARRLIMRAAAIDIGTNTVRLLIVEAVGTSVETVVRDQVITRLGEGVGKSGLILPEAATRTLEVLLGYLRRCRESKVSRTVVTGSAVLRDAANAEEFVNRVRGETGLAVDILSGEGEARLSYAGVASGRQEGPLVVIDLGGGSTELVFGKGSEVISAASINVGSVRLTEQYLHSDPPTGSEQAELVEYARSTVAPHARRILTAAGRWRHKLEAAGVGGTITTLSAINLDLAIYDRVRVHHSALTVEILDRVLDRLARMKLHERKQVRGLQPERADVIIGGILIVRETLRALGLDGLWVSESDLLDALATSVLMPIADN
ncbi:MAG: hypothetical protein ACE5E0_02680 [Terriglobia bacterium]